LAAKGQYDRVFLINGARNICIVFTDNIQATIQMSSCIYTHLYIEHISSLEATVFFFPAGYHVLLC
jgi:hypothetical protein